MKKILIKSLFILGLSTSFFNLKAQDTKRTFGVGFQSSFPVYGLSVKYAISKPSVVQVVFAPFGSGTYKINFYGGRYIYRFITDKTSNLDPYVSGGLGLISFSSSFDLSGPGKKNDNFLSYSVGGGIEYIAAHRLGLSVDLGYGKFNVSNGVGGSGIFFGAGIHYYIK